LKALVAALAMLALLLRFDPACAAQPAMQSAHAECAALLDQGMDHPDQEHGNNDQAGICLPCVISIGAAQIEAPATEVGLPQAAPARIDHFSGIRERPPIPPPRNV
jgi:hypothetical protein